MFSNASKASLCRFCSKMWDLPQIMAIEVKPLQLKVRVSIEQRHVRSFPLNHWKKTKIRFKSRFCCCVADRIKIQGLLCIFKEPVRHKFMWIQPLGNRTFSQERKEKEKKSRNTYARLITQHATGWQRTFGDMESLTHIWDLWYNEAIAFWQAFLQIHVFAPCLCLAVWSH